MRTLIDRPYSQPLEARHDDAQGSLPLAQWPAAAADELDEDASGVTDEFSVGSAPDEA
jgi:hypothetical protein